MIEGFDAKGAKILANRFLKDPKEAESQIEKRFFNFAEMNKDLDYLYNLIFDFFKP